MAAPSPEIQDIASEIGAGCLALRARLISRTITGLYNQALAPVGLTTGQLSILSVIAQKGPLPPGEIASLLHIEKSTMSRNVERMRKSGLVSARAAGSGHQQKLTLLAKGRKALKRALPAWREAQAQAAGLLTQRGARAIRDVADTVSRCAEHHA